MPVARPLIDRIWAKTLRPTPNTCWPWTGSVGNKGQPLISTQENGHKGSKSVRRIVWAHMTKSPPSAQRWVRTTCGNPICLNPRHLELRTIRDDLGRFWECVDKGGPIVRPELGPCWVWKGSTRKGYGLLGSIGRKRCHVFAHRFSYELAHGPIEGHVPHTDQEIVVMHICDNPLCVNPAHLRLGTDKDNVADAIAKGRNSRGEKHGAAVRAARAARAAQRSSREKGGAR